MRVAIAGGSGKIALRLTRLLRARGDEVCGLIRDPHKAELVSEAGGEPVVCDLEVASDDEIAAAVGDGDAVVFAAGAGPGSGPDRKLSMDRDGAIKLIAAARANGIRRYLIVSSMGADPDLSGDETFAVYQRAKGEADRALAESGLDWTIVRPTRLTDDPGSGRVELGEGLSRAEISRDDVAAVLVACLDAPNAIGKRFEAVAGERPIEEAVSAL